MWKVILFYKYVLIEQLDDFVDGVKAKCELLGLKGRVLISKEGINGTVAGTNEDIQVFIEYMVADFRFSNVDWKESLSANDSPPFPNLSVRIVDEIISCGSKGSKINNQLHFEPEIFGGLAESGQHLSPQEFHDAAADSNAVILDIRNQYEYDIGHFQRATNIGTYTYAETFDNLDEMLDQQKLQNGGKILMYCTGGIRCEKASAYLRLKGLDNVCQLHGGIHRYLQAYPDGGLFAGKNFVFDSRVAMAPIDTTVDSFSSGETSSSTVIVGRCIECMSPYDRYSGKVVCTVCRMPVLVCPACIDSNPYPNEYYCIRHRDLKGLYLTVLESYPIEELRRQYDGLQRLLQLSLQAAEERKGQKMRMRRQKGKKQVEDVHSADQLPRPELSNLGHKRRKTIRKQLVRLEIMMNRMVKSTDGSVSVAAEEMDFSQPKSRLGLGFWTT